MDLRKKRDVGAEIVRLDRRPHAGKAGADDEHVVRCFHQQWTLSNERVHVSCDSRLEESA
jgi:hypothetical protein